MLRYVYDRPEPVAAFVAQMIPHARERGFGKCSAIGVIDEDGRLIAGIVYHHWAPEAGVVEISGAATHPRWLTRESLRVMFQYPFQQLGCQMVVMRVDAANERLLRQLAVYGFSFIRIPRLLGRDKDCILCLLTQEDWEANKFNKRLGHHLPVMPLEEAA